MQGETLALFVCHCTECQHQSASAFGLALWLGTYRLEILEGEPRTWTRTTPTGRRQLCQFCQHCGTRLFHQMEDRTDIISIKPGTLDTTLALEPVAHIWTSSARSWIEVPSHVLTYPENPPTFDEIFATWQSQKARQLLSD
jgi:hypothetical protein